VAHADDRPNQLPQIDLHRLNWANGERTLRRALHAARVKGEAHLIVITGLGLGNATQQPVLRGHVEAWLRGEEARRLGVLGFRRVSRGGALELSLLAPRDRERVERHLEEE
jgi:DNA-nicking Smr family endonuclease